MPFARQSIAGYLREEEKVRRFFESRGYGHFAEVRVMEISRVLRAIGTIAVVCAFASTALADSVLNFTPKGNAEISVTNTTPFVADVKFTLYNTDGTVASTNLTNPFTHRIAPMGQLKKPVSDIFRMKPGTWTSGWIQATSSVNGLQGYYFSGDFSTTFSGNTFDGAEASSPLHLQTIPHIVSGAAVLLTNPGTQNADVVVSFRDTNGKEVGQWSDGLPPRAQVSLKGAGATARIEVKAGPAILATAVAESGKQLVLIHGQATDTRIGRWIIPHFRNSGGTSSRLVLSNPSPAPAFVSVTFFDNKGEPLFATTGSESITIGPSASTVVDWIALTKLSTLPDGDGWLRVDSTVPLVGVALVDDGLSSTAIPLQSSGSDRILLSRAATQAFTSELIVVGNDERNATLTITFNRPDGTTVMQRDVDLPARWRQPIALADWIPASVGFDNGFVAIRSSAPVYAVGSVRLGYGDGLAHVSPQRLSTSFAPAVVNVNTAKVSLVDIEPAPGARLKITSDGGSLPADATLWVGDKAIPLTATSQGFDAILPAALDPGVVTARFRAGGVESISQLGFYSSEFQLQEEAPLLKGAAFFQKVEVTDSGLDTSQTSLVPIRFARVEVVEILNPNSVVVVTETDEMGRFETRIPYERGLEVRVFSRSRLQDLRVLNNTAGNSLYWISKRIESTADEIELIDNSRSAGAFNILDTIQRGNALLSAAVPAFVPPALTVYWSERNNDTVLSRLTNGAIRTTFFSLAANAAYVLGDRNTDSDEFDDSVILHEYAHMLAAKFSRDDSNGGTHLPGDLLDPRVAWSEGWANFFSSAARGTSVYRDSKAGNNVLRFDIEDNAPAGERPGGYFSEASVHGLLWDLIDENADNGDAGQFSFASIWGAFTELIGYRNVYLPYFLDRFLMRHPQSSDALRTMVGLRNIDFQPDGRPSVTNPFPRTIGINETKHNQQVDSFTSRRTNLALSAHTYSLTVPTGGLTTIRLVVDGSAPANNPSFNDLDLVLYDSTGRKIIAVANSGMSGAGEVITENLAAGNYFIEVRSFYTSADSNTMIFNSGTYRLSVTR
jgi:hypothetical protein